MRMKTIISKQASSDFQGSTNILKPYIHASVCVFLVLAFMFKGIFPKQKVCAHHLLLSASQTLGHIQCLLEVTTSQQNLNLKHMYTSNAMQFNLEKLLVSL